MKEENNFFSKLLTLEELCSLYFQIGDTILTEIDLKNTDFASESRANSLILLKKCGFISSTDDNLSKIDYLESREQFVSEVNKRINEIFKDEINRILSLEKTYDETKNSFYIPRNFIDLDLSGLLMMLSQVGRVQLTQTRVYIVDWDDVNEHQSIDERKKLIILEDFEKGLILKKKLGEEAEKKALSYEIDILIKQGIDKIPRIISDTDVSAGYDIISYMSCESVSIDKFIEVKNCDNRLDFYISQNELKVASIKGDNYYLYLYNRDSDEMVIIRNPYKEIFESNNWASVPQIYKIHKIK